MKIAPWYLLAIIFLTSFVGYDNDCYRECLISNFPKGEGKVISIITTNKLIRAQTSQIIQQQVDSLIKYSNILKAGGSKQKYERLFFDVFPSNFERMDEIFGPHAPLHRYDQGEPIINCFKSLTTIPKTEYYHKYTGICINGKWFPDHLIHAFGFHEKLLLDTKATCSSLEKRTDKEIKSIFRFIFDGPHPKHWKNERIFKDLKSKISIENPRLAKLLTESYKQLMAEDHSH